MCKYDIILHGLVGNDSDINGQEFLATVAKSSLTTNGNFFI